MTAYAAARYSGPSVTLSYLLAGCGCMCAGLCYAELASMSPQPGSAYTYARSCLGTRTALLIGWVLVLEFLFGASAAAVGWSGFLISLLRGWGLDLPLRFMTAPVHVTDSGSLAATGAIGNVPAAALVFAQAYLLSVGIRESKRAIAILSGIYVAVLLLIIAIGLLHANPDNWHPFIPRAQPSGRFGLRGIGTAAGIVFFCYTGFEVVSTATREARNPRLALPIGLLGSLVACGTLYVLMSLTLTGLVPYEQLGGGDPLGTAVQAMGSAWSWLLTLGSAGAAIGMSTASMGSMYAQIRIFYTMAEDGLMPSCFSRVDARHRTPRWNTLIVGSLCGAIAGLLPLEMLGELVSAGTLLAFSVVCLSVLLLRRRLPDAHRSFRTPLPYVFAPLGMVVCSYMMFSLPANTWIRFAAWMLAGYCIYWMTSRRRRLRYPAVETREGPH